MSVISLFFIHTHLLLLSFSFPLSFLFTLIFFLIFVFNHLSLFLLEASGEGMVEEWLRPLTYGTKMDYRLRASISNRSVDFDLADGIC